MKLSVLIPCYNEEENLPLLIQNICDTFKHLDFECVFVNDGSNDRTQELLKTLAVRYSLNCKVIEFTRNFGKESAMYARLSECEGELISLLDADLQQKPETVLEMVRLLEENPGIDMVAAVQDHRKESFLLQKCKSGFYRIANLLSDVEFQKGASDFRTFRRNVAEALLSMNESERFSKGLFSWGGFRVYYLPYEAAERNAGKSKWSFFRLLDYALKGIVSFSAKPLRLSFLFGFLCLIAFCIVVFYSPLIGVVLLSTSVQLICMGIMGEYISGIFAQSKNRPAFLIRERYTHSGTDREEQQRK